MNNTIINNMGGGLFVASERSLMQQELIRASVEYEKQFGIVMQLMSKLKDKKVEAIEKKYKNISVSHSVYGKCNYDFYATSTDCSMTITLEYWVRKVPLCDLSGSDQKTAKRYNECSYSYRQARSAASEFKSLKDVLTGEVSWGFDKECICDDKFFDGGLSVEGYYSGLFTIDLK